MSANRAWDNRSWGAANATAASTRSLGGCRRIPDGGASWAKDGSDLPNVNIGDLLIDEDANKLYAGTYGRGAWMATIPSDLSIFTDGFELGSTSLWSAVSP